MDAGPNVKILTEKKNQQYILNALLQHFKEEQVIASDITHTGIEILE